MDFKIIKVTQIHSEALRGGNRNIKVSLRLSYPQINLAAPSISLSPTT